VTLSKNIAVVGALVLALTTSLAVRSLQQQNQRILSDLSELIEKTTAGHDRVKLTNLIGDFLGDANAPLTMVEYTDLQCPFCRQFHLTTFEQIKRHYIDTGRLRYITQDFPLGSIHPLAIAAARAARCAGDGGKSWEMRHSILANNASLRPDIFVTFARDLKLNVGEFKSCMADTVRLDKGWRKDKADGASVGVSGTPSFVIGRSSVNGLDGIRIVGVKPYSVFDATFNELLAASSSAQ
jgi:protein-disulfide isomerase